MASERKAEAKEVEEEKEKEEKGKVLKKEVVEEVQGHGRSSTCVSNPAAHSFSRNS